MSRGQYCCGEVTLLFFKVVFILFYILFWNVLVQKSDAESSQFYIPFWNSKFINVILWLSLFLRKIRLLIASGGLNA